MGAVLARADSQNPWARLVEVLSLLMFQDIAFIHGTSKPFFSGLTPQVPLLTQALLARLLKMLVLPLASSTLPISPAAPTDSTRCRRQTTGH